MNGFWIALALFCIAGLFGSEIACGLGVKNACAVAEAEWSRGEHD